VINYDTPANPFIYFNRIGRTARAGTTGKAISLVSQDRVEEFGRILKTTEKQVHKLNEEMGIEVPSVPQYPRRDYLQRHRSNFRDMTNIVAIETILTLAILAIEESAYTTGEIKSHYTGRNKSNSRYGTHYRYL
jgi:superfamily II DNA/RNA helicase